MHAVKKREKKRENPGVRGCGRQTSHTAQFFLPDLPLFPNTSRRRYKVTLCLQTSACPPFPTTNKTPIKKGVTGARIHPYPPPDNSHIHYTSQKLPRGINLSRPDSADWTAWW